MFFEANLRMAQETENPGMIPELKDFMRRRRRVNLQLLARIHQFYASSQFNGTPGPGVAKVPYQVDIPMESSGQLLQDDLETGASGSEDSDVEVNNEYTNAMDGVIQYINSVGSGCRLRRSRYGHKKNARISIVLHILGILVI